MSFTLLWVCTIFGERIQVLLGTWFESLQLFHLHVCARWSVYLVEPLSIFSAVQLPMGCPGVTVCVGHCVDADHATLSLHSPRYICKYSVITSHWALQWKLLVKCQCCKYFYWTWFQYLEITYRFRPRNGLGWRKFLPYLVVKGVVLYLFSFLFQKYTVQQPSVHPTFDLLHNDPWDNRKRMFRKFQQAAYKVKWTTRMQCEGMTWETAQQNMQPITSVHS